MRFPSTMILIGFFTAGTSIAVHGADGPSIPRVDVIETPSGGVQPQAIVDASGMIHLVYLGGEASAADVFYANRKPGEAAFGPSIRVNSHAGSAIAVGTVRGARIALGQAGRIHIAWNGSQKATPPNPISGSPLLYARSDESHTRFEPERNLMTKTHGLDGGGSVAADGSGNVYVTWHGQLRNSSGEGNRKVFLARSSDDGATFPIEEPSTLQPTGACGCCGTASLADSKGSVYLLYRAATDSVERDMILLTSHDKGRRFEVARLDPWRINACPMSTVSIVNAENGILAAWETKGQVAFASIDRKTGARTPSISPAGNDGTRKHPGLATNLRGETLLAWTEGTGWQKGGSLAWQVFDRSGQPLGPRGKMAGVIPVWGSITVVAQPGGGFTIIR